MHMEFTELGPIKILIVDDQQTNVRLMETLLQAEGYATVAAFNGREALTLAEAEKPDLILLDIMMPDMDGFEAVKRLKTDPLTQNIPVIMITALADQETKIRALQSGAEEFLVDADRKLTRWSILDRRQQPGGFWHCQRTVERGHWSSYYMSE